MSEEEVPLHPEEAKKLLQELGATIMFEKVLTTSDASGSGRIVIPKVCVTFLYARLCRSKFVMTLFFWIFHCRVLPKLTSLQLSPKTELF